MVEVELLNWSGRKSVEIVAEAAKITADGMDDVPNEKVIEMLVENDYSSALEHIWFTFRIKCSIGCQRQILEHRIASHTTRSTRYCDENVAESFEYPKKLSGEDKEDVERLLIMIDGVYKKLKEKYGRDVARYILPIGLQTEFVWTINARSLINFLGLRLCERAHEEIREVAYEVLEIVRELVPEIFEMIGCRGVNLGVCPENRARPKSCKWRKVIPTKEFVKMGGCKEWR